MVPLHFADGQNHPPAGAKWQPCAATASPAKAAKVLFSACERGRIHFFEEWIFMKKLKSKEVSTEVKCPACEGTGFPKVKQPVQPGRRIYPAQCEKCAGKGRIAPPRS
jgi:hypothetical protein